jgi:hypothetical protein
LGESGKAVDIAEARIAEFPLEIGFLVCDDAVAPLLASQVRIRLPAGGRWIRTFGPSVQMMLLDTADPLARHAGIASRNCAEMGFRLYLCGDLDGYRMHFFPGMP